MAKYAELVSNFEDYKDILKFKEDFKTNIVENGLDKVLEKSLEQLKIDLKFVVNEQVRTIPEEQKIQDQPLRENELGQPYINPPKSEAEILKFLTDGKVDLAKYNKSKDYSTLSETGIVFGHHSRGQKSANRIELRLDIKPDETVEQQYQKAKQFFENAIFGLPDNAGRMSYFMNPGIDITPHLKIKCSVFTGTSDTDGFEGMSPARRFQRDTHRRGFAQWTFKQDAVQEIRNKYINLTDVVNLIKEGDYDRAKKVLTKNSQSKKVPNPEKLQEMIGQVQKLRDNTSKTPSSMEDYKNLIELINNLYIRKEIKDGTTYYRLETNHEDITDTSIISTVNNAVRKWITENENDWFNDLVRTTERLIKYYTSDFKTTFRDKK